MLHVFIPDVAHCDLMAAIMRIVTAYVPGDIDTEFLINEALSEAGISPASCLEDAEPAMAIAA